MRKDIEVRLQLERKGYAEIEMPFYPVKKGELVPLKIAREINDHLSEVAKRNKTVKSELIRQAIHEALAKEIPDKRTIYEIGDKLLYNPEIGITVRVPLDTYKKLKDIQLKNNRMSIGSFIRYSLVLWLEKRRD